MNSRVVILGGGESGIGAAILAQLKGYKVFLSDLKLLGAEQREVLKNHHIDFEEGGHTEKSFYTDLVVKSPGISDDVPLIRKLRQKGVSVVSEIEFAYQFIQKSKVIAITGTNGKTTTSKLIYHLLKVAGYKVALGGNIGTSLSRLVAEGGLRLLCGRTKQFPA